MLFLMSFQMNAQGIEFFDGTWEEALAKAKAEEKIVFVDAYTTWCGPCKRMAKNVFTLPEVGEFYNANFINMKIDMEKKAGRAFQQKYPVTAFPTFYYIDEKGETVLTTKGGRSPEDFIGLGRSAVGKIDRSTDFVAAYEKGDRDPELVYNYVRALNKAGKPSLRIANDYIKSQKDLTTPQNLKFILEATTQADSRIFSLLIKNRQAIEKIASKEEVRDKIENACRATLGKSIEYESEDLFAEAKEKMKDNCPEECKEFAMRADMQYYNETNQPDLYVKSCNTFAKKAIKKDGDELASLAMAMTGAFSKNKKVLAAAEKIASKSVKEGKKAKHYFTYAEILNRNGKKKDALAAAKKCVALAADNPREKQRAEQLLKIIENG